jgi:hypothetical protein
VRHDCGVAGPLSHIGGGERLGEGADLVTLIRIELPVALSMPRERRSTFVTNRSSPTSWQRSPILSVRSFQPCQSSSDMPSSIEKIGYSETSCAR